MADERLHAVAYDVEHDGFLGVDAHAVQEVAAEGVIPKHFVGRDQGVFPTRVGVFLKAADIAVAVPVSHEAAS